MHTATYNPQIFIDGVELLDWSGFEVSRRIGEGETGFSVSLNRPIAVNSGAKITIRDGYGGKYVNLVDNKLIETAGNGTHQSQLSGTGSLITQHAPIRSIYFINQKWLKQRWPFYTLRNGIIFRSDPGKNAYKIHGVSPTRLFIDELPGKNMRDNEFTCVVMDKPTYSYIANYLAYQIRDNSTSMPYQIKTNIRDLTVQKVFVVQAGESYFQAIAKLYHYFRPMIKIDKNIINITDIGGDGQNRPTGSGAITVTEDSFSLYNYNKIINKNIIDHVLIIGPTKNFTYKYFKPISKTTLKGGSLSGQITEITSEEKHTSELDLTNSGSYYEMVNPSEDIISRTTKKTTIVMNSNTDDMATTREETCMYGLNDLLMHKTVITYEWADYHTMIKSTTDEWSLLPKLGSGYDAQYITSPSNMVHYRPTEYELVQTSRVIVKHNTVVEDIGLVESDKYIYKLIIYELDKIKKDGTDYYAKMSVYPAQDALRIGVPFYEESSDPDTGWRSNLELTEYEKVRVDIVSSSLIRKNITNFKLFPARSTVYKSEDVIIKRRKVQDMTEQRWTFVKYSNGSIVQVDDNFRVPDNYSTHPRVEVNCPDIIDAATAKAVASRIMASKPSENTVATIKTVIPITGVDIGQSIRIPDCQKEYFDWSDNTFKSADIEGKLYWINGAKRVVNFTGSWESNQRTFEAHDELELKEYF